MVIKNKPSKEKLKDLYINKELSPVEISKIYKCNPCTIREWLKKYDIKIRNIKEAQNTNRIKKIKSNNMKGDKNPAKREDIKIKMRKPKYENNLIKRKEFCNKISKRMKETHYKAGSDIAKKQGNSIRGNKNPAKQPDIGNKISKANIGRIGGFLGKKHTLESNMKRSNSLCNKEIDKFIKENQGKYFCQCGCKKEIIIKRWHFNKGIPKFISGHNSKGKNNPNWQGGKSFEIYPQEFKEIKSYIKNKYNNCDYISGIPKNICSPNEELSIHHIDYNKQNNNEYNLIPLSRKNHFKTNFNRFFWINLFKYALEYDKKYYKWSNLNE